MRRLTLVDEEIEEQDRDEICRSESDFDLPRASFEIGSKLRPRRSFHRRSASLASSLSLVNLRHSFHYDRLPPVPIQLTVIKLDGSRFGIDVQRAATVADLKRAVQGAFTHIPAKISWRHVWGHFCLSYYGEMLVKDDELIKDYGIKDGDELSFVRYVPTTYSLTKKQPRRRGDTPKACTASEILEEDELKEDDGDDMENPNSQECGYDDESPTLQQEAMFSSFFRGWFFYSRVESVQKPGLEPEPCSSRRTGGFFCCFRSMLQYYTNRPGYNSRVSQIES